MRKALLLLLAVLYAGMAAAGSPVIKKDSLERDTAKAFQHFTFESDFYSRQIYYGSYDSIRQASFSNSLQYEFKSGIYFSLATYAVSRTRAGITDIDLGFGWNYDINDSWSGDLGFVHYINIGATRDNLRNVFRNYLTGSIENDNDYVNTGLRLSSESGEYGIRDLVADLTLAHDFYLVDDDLREKYFSVGLQNDLYAGSVNSAQAYALLNDGVIPVNKKLSLQPVSGLLYDNIAVPVIYEKKALKLILDLNYNVPFVKLPASVKRNTYLKNAPNFYLDTAIIISF